MARGDTELQMNKIARPFWNPVDRRLRALWRLILHTLLMAAIAYALTTLFISVFPEYMMDDVGATSPIAANELFSALLGALAIVSATLLAARFLDRRPVSDLGLQWTARWRRDLVFGLLLGALLMFLIFLVELALGWITLERIFATHLPFPFGLAILFPLALFLSVGVYEELMARGYQLKNMAEGLSFGPLGRKGGMLLALLLSSAIFGLLHAGNPNASTLSTFNISLTGLFLGLPVLLTDELAIPIGIHITWNFFQGNVFGFPVSGTATNLTTFVAVSQGGPDLWTGGAFGPEGGLLGIAAILTGSLLIVWWVKRTRGAVGFCLSVAEYQPPVSGERSAA